MAVDLYELPIPDWGLSCPQCGYPLKHLPSHRCPECGLALDMPALVPSWTALRPPRFDGGELPLPDFGRHCPGCGEPLAGATEHRCPTCGRAFDPSAWRPSRPWFVIGPELFAPLPLPFVESMLLAEQVPHPARPGLSVLGIAGVTLLVPSEYFYECLWLLRRARRRRADGTRETDETAWRCTACGEESPPTFEACWHCGAARGDTGEAGGPDTI